MAKLIIKVSKDCKLQENKKCGNKRCDYCHGNKSSRGYKTKCLETTKNEKNLATNKKVDKSPSKYEKEKESSKKGPEKDKSDVTGKPARISKEDIDKVTDRTKKIADALEILRNERGEDIERLATKLFPDIFPELERNKKHIQKVRAEKMAAVDWMEFDKFSRRKPLYLFPVMNYLIMN